MKLFKRKKDNALVGETDTVMVTDVDLSTEDFPSDDEPADLNREAAITAEISENGTEEVCAQTPKTQNGEALACEFLKQEDAEIQDRPNGLSEVFAQVNEALKTADVLPSEEECSTQSEVEEESKASEVVQAAEIDTEKNETAQAHNVPSDGPMTAEERFLNRIRGERSTDVDRAKYIYGKVAEKVEEAGKARYAGSTEEKRAAAAIRDVIEEEIGEYARLEPFDVRPYSTSQGLPVFAALSLLAFVLACIWPPLGVVSFAAVALLLWVQVFKNRNDFSGLFPKRTSYNVVSVIEEKGRRIDKTVVLGCHYDTDYGRMELPKWISKQNNPGFHNLMLWYFLSCNLLLALLSLVCIFLKTGPKAIVMLVGFIALAVAVAYMATYVTYFKLGARMNKNALSGLGVTLAAVQHVKINREELPSNVRLVVVAFGSSYAGAKGSEAFLAEHLGKDNLLINPVFVDVSALRQNNCDLIVSDKALNLVYSDKLTETAFDVLKENGLSVEKVVEQRRYADATSFATKGIDSVFVDGGIKKEGLFGVTESEVEDRYNAVLNVVRRIIKQH